MVVDVCVDWVCIAVKIERKYRWATGIRYYGTDIFNQKYKLRYCQLDFRTLEEETEFLMLFGGPYK